MKTIIDSYSKFHLWANERMADFLKNIDEDILAQEIASSFPSILHTLSHINKVHDFWLGFIATGELSDFDWTDKELSKKYQVTQLVESSERMVSTFIRYDQAALEEVLELRSSWAAYDESRFHFIMHVINHTTFHRGQVISMARIIGIKDKFPNSDYMSYFAKKL